MTLPEPQTRTFSALLAEIENGQTKIPQFQREFVWSLGQSANLMDSIIKGYPIGTFIFWNTNERLRAVRDIGNFVLPEPQDGVFVNYVLDGQQRMTSLFASLKGLKVQRESGKIDDFAEIYIDLEATEDDQIVLVDITGKNEGAIIRITELLNAGLKTLAKYEEVYHSKLDLYKKTIQAYNYSIILLKNAPIDIATEVFTRINEGGKKLSLFEIMIAKTYDYNREFDLATKYRELISELVPVNFETISDATILQTVAIILEKDCKRQEILKLDKQKFIDEWDNVILSIKKAIEYFKFTYRIPVSKLLPYNALVVPFAYFFYHYKKQPTGDKQKYLQDFFWRCALSGRYSSAVESKLAQDIKRMDEILEGKLPRYDWAIDTSPEFIKNNGWFSASRSYIKAILCIYAYQQPKSFNSNGIVNISNNWLTIATSKNYHHFFPKAYLKKKLNWEHKEFYINHIVNITIVDDYLNKREISAKAPSKYMKEFAKNNKVIGDTMQIHLINDIDLFGIWKDDYAAFFNNRAEAISVELKKRVIEAEIDKQMDVVLNEFDEVEEDVTED
jgi:hypothetical protein